MCAFTQFEHFSKAAAALVSLVAVPHENPGLERMSGPLRF